MECLNNFWENFFRNHFQNHLINAELKFKLSYQVAEPIHAKLLRKGQNMKTCSPMLWCIVPASLAVLRQWDTSPGKAVVIHLPAPCAPVAKKGLPKQNHNKSDLLATPPDPSLFYQGG